MRAIRIAVQLHPQQGAYAELRDAVARVEEAGADLALQTLDVGTAGTTIADRLEAEGFGRRTRPTAASVLERLRQRQTEAPKPDSTTSTPVNPEPVS